MEGELSTLKEAYEQLQAQPSKIDVPSSSTPITCDHANIIEENARLKVNLANAISRGKRPFVPSKEGRSGVGFVEEEKKESFMKDARAPQAKKTNATFSFFGRDKGPLTTGDGISEINL